MDYYSTYRSEGTSNRRSRIYSFFRAVISYIFRRALPVSLSENDRVNFEGSLHEDLTSKFDIFYAPGSITLRPKDLTGGLV